MKMGETQVKSSNCENQLRIKIYVKLTFNEHLNSFIDRASHKTELF